MKEVIGFHDVDKENGFLSNWYPSPFELGSVRFSCMEQYMMYQKAVLFGDADSARRILRETDPQTIKALGKQVAGYDDAIWSGVRQIVIYRGLLAKFSQNVALGKLLRETGDAILAECAVRDRIWGIGLSPSDPRRLDLREWRGQNLLGFALMQAREELYGF